jgi:hypothetical protein
MSEHPIRLHLSAVDPCRREEAQEALLAGDVRGFLSTTDDMRAWELVRANRGALWLRGLYERAVIEALTICCANNADTSEREIARVLRQMARGTSLKRLRDIYPPPGAGPWELYRSVSGRGAARWVRGIIWMQSLETARHFAERSCLEEPSVYRTIVPDRYVLACVPDGPEELFIVRLPERMKVERVWP